MLPPSSSHLMPEKHFNIGDRVDRKPAIKLEKRAARQEVAGASETVEV